VPAVHAPSPHVTVHAVAVPQSMPPVQSPDVQSTSHGMPAGHMTSEAQAWPAHVIVHVPAMHSPPYEAHSIGSQASAEPSPPASPPLDPPSRPLPAPDPPPSGSKPIRPHAATASTISHARTVRAYYVCAPR
jgi:hypothetical protein